MQAAHARAHKAVRRPGRSGRRASVLPGALWGASCLLIVLAVAFMLVRAAIPGTSWPPTTAYALLAVAALSMLAMVVYTLPRERAYEWDADLSVFPGAVRWPLTVGTWLGYGVVFVVGAVMVFSTPGGGVGSASARFCMSVIAALGAVVTAFTGLPMPAVIALMTVWGAVVVIALLRGAYGLGREIVRAFAPASRR